MSTATSSISTAAVPQGRFSLGPVKLEIHDIGLVSGDTAATATAKNLTKVEYAILIAGVVQTAVPTYSTNVATFAFTDPVATVKGHVLLFGR